MILVTGGAGYIGSHCILDLIKNGYDVAILDNLSTGHIQTVETLQSLDYKGRVVDFFKVDLRDIEKLNNAFSTLSHIGKIDAVIHFAAASLVGESATDPQKYWRNNVVGGLNLLDVMLKYDVKNIIFSSTCATYGEPKYVPIDENHPQKPINPYGKSKLALENAIIDYSKAYGLNSVIFRYFNVFGASSDGFLGEWHDVETHLVPNVMKSILKGESGEFELYGDNYETPDGTCIRDYINVEDLVRAHRLGYEYLLNSPESTVINLGTEHGHSVKEILDTCEKILEKEIPIKLCPRREGDPATLVANASCAKEILKWEAETDIENSIKTAYNWELQLTNIKKESLK
ncbi:UDP-glucose 4-epimerase [Candidatus Gastranaerophilus sp. (ex Termes propinquus)]|nr:UDP-glucose 4-epimerase [Candidatus Gastranaerophilus sp. (ex Termes propinquus)]